MKPRKSTAVLAVLWLATVAVYIMVKPEVPQQAGLPIIDDTSFQKLTVGAPAPPH